MGQRFEDANGVVDVEDDNLVTTFEDENGNFTGPTIGEALVFPLMLMLRLRLHS